MRQSGTVVGSLRHNDPAGDWGVVALASRAEMVIRSKGGDRVVPIDDFLIDSFTTAVAEGEIGIEVRFPTPGTERRASIRRSNARSASSQRPRPAYNRPTAKRVALAEAILVGARPSKAVFRAAAAEAREIADPVADTRGDVDSNARWPRACVAASSPR